ncbi:hypothetical protein F5148DRAFT_1014960 [Russula earlei]|uniref:Uncharacterized protein n=1 Tax=Russula earlei TaxID=71964 RepID=A0ACC0U7F0_9AGAM|nr:hypothetical protein F5148DRAFT_1014960 [Russula earlei]
MKVDPNFAFVTARNEEELTKVAGSLANVFTTARQASLKRFAAFPDARANLPFYCKQLASISGLHALLNGQATDDVKRDFFVASAALWDAIRAFIFETLPAALGRSHPGGDAEARGGPFFGGERPGVDDFHVGVWLARIAFVLGARQSEEGVPALERTFGPLPESVESYWAG